MSDAFGISQAIEGAVNIYLRSARGTGRTTSMVEMLKEGDCVCFITEQEARDVQRLCKERDFNIEFEIVDPKNPGTMFHQGSKKGRYILDHRWVEEFYKHAILNASQDIRSFQNEKSGFGEPHLETRRKAYEINKWRV